MSEGVTFEIRWTHTQRRRNQAEGQSPKAKLFNPVDGKRSQKREVKVMRTKPTRFRQRSGPTRGRGEHEKTRT